MCGPKRMLLPAAFWIGRMCDMTCTEYEEWRRQEEWLRHRDEYLKIDVEALLGTVNDYFEDIGESSKFVKEHPFYSRTDKEERRMLHLDDRLNGSDNRVCDICRILRVDRSRLECVARLVNRWEKKCRWEKCFPVAAHAAKILSFIKRTREEM